MRISDWSSDVCSSDLSIRHGISGTPHSTSGTESRSNGNAPQGISGTQRRYFGNGSLFPTRLESVSRAASAHSRSEEHTSELQSLMRISYAVFCLKKKKKRKKYKNTLQLHTKHT